MTAPANEQRWTGPRHLLQLTVTTPPSSPLHFCCTAQTGNSHMALLTAPEGSDLEEFRRTRAFVMTHDDDGPSCSCSSSSSDR
jgi:hypothetical protein